MSVQYSGYFILHCAYYVSSKPLDFWGFIYYDLIKYFMKLFPFSWTSKVVMQETKICLIFIVFCGIFSPYTIFQKVENVFWYVIIGTCVGVEITVYKRWKCLCGLEFRVTLHFLWWPRSECRWYRGCPWNSGGYQRHLMEFNHQTTLHNGRNSRHS